MLRNLPGDFFLDGENIVEFAAEITAPQVRVPNHINKLDFDGQCVAALHYAPGLKLLARQVRY